MRWLVQPAERSINAMTVKPAELTILRYPDAALRSPARAISKIDDEVRAVVNRMIDLMHEANGVGLAAPQVGLPWRLFVTEVPDDKQTRVYINPKLVLGTDTSVYEEGCLSLPGVHIEIERPSSATLLASDLDGREVTVASDGFPARVWQHEFDHLNGVLIIDRIPADERKALRQQLKAATALGGRIA